MNPYKVLQVDPDAEREVIEVAYKRLASKYHPDKDPSTSATAKMQEINAAYEILKDPERKGQHDRERLRAEQLRQEADDQGLPPEVKLAVEEVSTRVFGKILWAATLIALVIYVPWLVPVGIALWAIVWFVQRNPRAVGKTIQTGKYLLVRGIGLTVAIAVAVWVRELMQEQRAEAEAKAELKKLNVEDSMGVEIGQFIASCERKASQKAPDLANAYCSCVAQSLQSRFNYTPITATSVSDYREQFSARFEAAVPNKTAQTNCFNQVRPQVVPTATPAKPPRVRNPVAPARDGTDPALKAFMDSLQRPTGETQ